MRTTYNFRILIVLFLLVLQGACGQLELKDESNSIIEEQAREYFDNDLQVRLAGAISKNNIQNIELLIQEGADVNFVGKQGMTPLFWALQRDYLEGFRVLLDSGGDPNLVVDRGEGLGRLSVMQLVAIMDDSEFLLAALENNGNPDALLSSGNRTLLYYTILHNKEENLKILLHAGASIDWKDSSGKTPLLRAAAIKNYNLVYILLEFGADPSIKDKYDYDLVDLINEFGARGIKKESEQYEWYKKVLDRLDVDIDKAGTYDRPPKQQ
jgi:uncharacterized protein